MEEQVINHEEILRDIKAKKDNEYLARFEALCNSEAAANQININNAKLYFEQHIHFNHEKNSAEVEERMCALERSDAIIKYDIDLNYCYGNRQREYQLIDGLFKEALVEFICEERPKKMYKYKELRKKVKSKYPKPEKVD